MGPELPAPWLLLFTWLPTGEPWGNGSYPGAQVDRKPLLPGLAELATGWAVKAWAALWRFLARAPGGAGTGSSFCLWEPVVSLSLAQALQKQVQLRNPESLGFPSLQSLGTPWSQKLN